MLKSGLLHFFLLIALALVTTQVWAKDDFDGGLRKKESGKEGLGGKRVDNARSEAELQIEVLRSERRSSGSHHDGPRERAAPVAAIPQPTAAPPLPVPVRKRQDNGQIQALSSQLQSLSESATKAMSSVSSSASSVISLMSQTTQSIRQSAEAARQSADQAVREASQAADQAGRLLSQTESSASSAAASMSSRMASDYSSMQSSASSRISAVRAEASASVVSMMSTMGDIMASISASPTAAGGPAVSGTTVALIVVASIVATAAITTLAVFLFMRHRRQKKNGEEERQGDGKPGSAGADEKPPVAIQGMSPGTPRNFTPWGGATYPMDKMKLPDLSALRKPRRAAADTRTSIGLATSSYDTRDRGGAGSDGGGVGGGKDNGDLYGVSANSFRLQKPDNISRAMSVRLIRVGSGKSNNSNNSGSNKSDRSDNSNNNKEKATAGEESERSLDGKQQQQEEKEPIPAIPPPPPPPIPASPDAAAGRRTYMSDFRSSVSSKASEPALVLEPIATRTARAGSTATSNAQRYRFRDSSDVESDAGSTATPNTFGPPRRGSHRNTGSSHATSVANRASLSTIHSPSLPMETNDNNNNNNNSNNNAAITAITTAAANISNGRKSSEEGGRPPRMPPRSPRRPRGGSNSSGGGGATFAAFPKVRTVPPPKLNPNSASSRATTTTPTPPPLTPRSALAAQIRTEAERRGRELVDATRSGGDNDDDDADEEMASPGGGGGRGKGRTPPKSPRNPNWPFNTGNVG